MAYIFIHNAIIKICRYSLSSLIPGEVNLKNVRTNSTRFSVHVCHTLIVGPKFAVQYEKFELPTLKVLKDAKYCIQRLSVDNRNEIGCSISDGITKFLQTPLNVNYENKINNSYDETKTLFNPHPELFVR